MANLAIFAAVTLFIFNSRGTSQTTQAVLTNSNDAESAIENPLDELSGADVAVHLAQMARLDESKAVANNADSINAQLAIVPTDSQVVAKPQIVTTALKSKKDIKVYQSKSGDTVSSVAAAFGVTSDSVKWSNDLSGETIAPNKELIIPPVNGLVYTVKSGDTPDSIATKYRANKDQIIAFNDAEISGLVIGERIVIPDGVVPAPVVRSVPTYSGFAWGGASAIYGSNGYDYGYCTWYAAKRRAEIGRPVPSNLGNASTWKVLAARAGYGVGNVPQAGAVIWTPPRDYYGHVGFVEEVFEDGRVRVSEMNTAGWAVRSEKILSAEQAAGYSYIY